MTSGSKFPCNLAVVEGFKLFEVIKENMEERCKWMWGDRARVKDVTSRRRDRMIRYRLIPCKYTSEEGRIDGCAF